MEESNLNRDGFAPPPSSIASGPGLNLMFGSIKNRVLEKSKELKEKLDFGMSDVVDSVSTKLPIIPAAVNSAVELSNTVVEDITTDTLSSLFSTTMNSANQIDSDHWGEKYCEFQHHQLQRISKANTALEQKGHAVAFNLSKSRKVLVKQVQSQQKIEQLIVPTFHDSLQHDIRNLRTLIQDIQEVAKQVEQQFINALENQLALENSKLVQAKEHELQVYAAEQVYAQERKENEFLEERRKTLSEAFDIDIAAYRAAVEEGREKNVFLNVQVPYVAAALEEVELELQHPSLECFYTDDEETQEEEEEEGEKKVEDL